MWCLALPAAVDASQATGRTPKTSGLLRRRGDAHLGGPQGAVRRRLGILRLTSDPRQRGGRRTLLVAAALSAAWLMLCRALAAAWLAAVAARFTSLAAACPAAAVRLDASGAISDRPCFAMAAMLPAKPAGAGHVAKGAGPRACPVS